jgi:hypothetical protein
MAGANTSRTGQGKLMSSHAIHCKVPEDEYKEFRRWCIEHGTTPTSHLREMVLEHNQTRRPK